jgi:hypothetical protein
MVLESKLGVSFLINYSEKGDVIMGFFKQFKKWIDNHELLVSVAVITLIGLIAFIPSMKGAGFFGDDNWMMFGAYTAGPEKIIESTQIDRPGMGYTLQLIFRLFGFQIHYYKILVLTLSILTALIGLWLVRELFHVHKRVAFAVGVLLVIYPGFTEGMNSYTFCLFSLNIFLYVLSIALTAKVLLTQNKLAQLGLTLLSLVSFLWSVLLNEYYLGLEVLRFGIIFLILFEKQNKGRKNVVVFLKSISTYLVYFLCALFFFIWRFFIFTNQRSATDLGTFLTAFWKSLFYEGSTILRGLFNNLLNISIFAWFEPAYKQLNSLRLKDFIFCALLSLIGSLIVFWILGSKKEKDIDGLKNQTWWKKMVILGVITILGTSLPIVFVNRTATFADYGRYTLSGMLGGILIVIGLAYRFIKPGLRNFFLSFLVFAGIFTQLGIGKGLAQDWTASRELWWELAWRAPSLKPGTLLTGEITNYRIAEGFSLWAPASLMYYPDRTNPTINGDALNTDFIQAVMMGKDSTRDFRSYTLERKTDSLLVLSKPSALSCLHLIDGQAPDYSIFDSANLLLIGNHSKLDQIDLEATPSAPPGVIFGSEPVHGWCFYYQKAELAFQKGDFLEVVRLRDEASLKGLKQNDAIELIPFILVYAETGNDDQLNKILPIFFSYPFHKVNYCNNLINDKYQISDLANQKLIKLSCLGEQLSK